METLSPIAFGDDRLPSRFWDKVRQEEKCWIWTGSLSVKGYGRFFLNGKVRWAHRLIYTLTVKDPGELVVDHKCQTPACVNPNHFQAISNLENVKLAAARRATCGNGHTWLSATTYTTPAGVRVCKICRREKDKRRTRSKV